MGTFQSWVAPFMSVSTTKRTAHSTIMPPPFATIELVRWISFGTFRTTLGRPWVSLLYAYFKARGDEKNPETNDLGMTRYYIYFGAGFTFDWRIGILFVLVPLLTMNSIMATTS
jgi:hypothetical protein